MQVQPQPGTEPFCKTKMVRRQFATEIFRLKEAFHRLERALCWYRRPFVGLRDTFGALEGLRDLLSAQEVHVLA